jgi:hypothetical protein
MHLDLNNTTDIIASIVVLIGLKFCAIVMYAVYRSTKSLVNKINSQSEIQSLFTLHKCRQMLIDIIFN